MYIYVSTNTYIFKTVCVVMASRAQSRLSRLLQNKQDTSGIFAFIFTSLLSHDVDVSMVIKTVISKPTPGQASPKMSLLSGCFKNRIKQASDLREVSLPCRHDQKGRLCQRSLRLPVNLLNKTSFLKSRKGFNASSALVSTAGAESRSDTENGRIVLTLTT